MLYKNMAPGEADSRHSFNSELGQCSEGGEDTINNENYSGSLLISFNPPQEVNDLFY